MRIVTDAGETIEIGTTETAPTIGIRDFSRRATDDYGVTTVVERGFARTMAVKVAVPFDDVDRLQRRLADLRAKPVRFVADDRFDSLSVRGFYKDLSFDLAYPPISYCTLSVEGLVASDDLVDRGGDPAPEGQPSTLQLLQPAIVTTGVLVASSVAEVDAAEWSPTSTYAKGERVIRAATHRVYESLVAGNRGDDPAGGSTKWLDVGPTNRWAMFDQALGTSTTANGTLTVTLDAGTVDAVALLDVVGESVRVQAAGYDRTMAVGGGTVTVLDLAGRTGQVTVRVAGSAVSVGTLLIGRLASLGITEASPTASITDYSRKAVDDFGDVEVVERAWAKRMAAKALIRTDAIDLVANRIAAVRARPSLWIGQAGLDSLTIYGFFKDFSVEVGQTVSKLSLSVEGLSKAAKPAPLKVAVDYADLTDRTGTKPADNADVTGDNTSKDTKAVAGRPVAGVLAGIDGNTFRQAIAAANAETARLRTRALNFPGPAGEDSFTLLRRETIERKDADGVFAETFDLLLARTPDGQAVVLKVDTVQIGAGQTLAQRFELIAAAFRDNAASIERTDQVLFTEDGVTARSLNVVKVDVNGVSRIVGTALTNDGTIGAYVISADQFRVEDPVTGRPFIYADAARKLLIAQNVEVDTLKVGAVGYDAMKLGAAQKVALHTLPGSVAVPRNATVEIATVSFVKEDADSILEIQMLIKCASDDDFQFDATIQIDGMVMDTTPVNLVLVRNNARLPITPFTYAAGIGAGPRTVSVKIYNRENDADDLSVLAGSTLKVTELRKGSIGSSTGSGGAIPTTSGTGGGGTYRGGTPPTQMQ